MSLQSPTLWALFLNLQVPALRVLYRHTPDALVPLIPVMLAALLACTALLLEPRVARWADRRFFLWWGLVLITAATAVGYPLADGLKAVGQGSDQDDAIIVAATHLAAGDFPYSATTYLDRSLSPGPGWILLWLPLVLLGIPWLITPVTLGLVALTLERTRGRASASRFLLLLASSVAFWRQLATGSDLLAIGCLVLITAEVASCRTSPWIALLLALLAGAVGTSRIVFFYYPLLIGLALWPISRQRACILAGVGTLTCLGLHLVFYLWRPESYQPLHLLSKAEQFLSPGYWVALGLACGIAAIILLWITRRNRRQQKPTPGLLVIWIGMIIPLVIVALGDLQYASFELAWWRGCSWLLPGLPLILGTALATAPEPHVA